MVSNDTFRQMALSFADMAEMPHFEVTSFRIKKKIVTSLDEGKARACLKFTPEAQQEFAAMDKAIYPVPNKWGTTGWTFVELATIREELLYEALEVAYRTVLGK
jgi:hypothetical protein